MCFAANCMHANLHPMTDNNAAEQTALALARISGDIGDLEFHINELQRLSGVKNQHALTLRTLSTALDSLKKTALVYEESSSVEADDLEACARKLREAGYRVDHLPSRAAARKC